MTPHVRLLSYEIPLKQPIRLNRGGQHTTLSSRQGLVLHWQFLNAEYFTEIAPLEGFSDETLQQALNQIISLKSKCFEPGTDLTGLYPSVRFAIEAGWYQHTYPFQNKTAHRCAFGSKYSSAETIKIKVGHRPLNEEVRGLTQQLSHLSAQQRFRLDANRSWSLKELEKVQQCIDLSRMDYIEEPLQNLDDYNDLKLPFAFDESLRDQSDITQLPSVFLRAKAWVVKPMMTGLQKTLQLAVLAKDNGIELILSSSFESHISLEFYHSLAYDLGLKSAQGLDTLSWLDGDLLPPKLPLRAKPVEIIPMPEVAILC